MYSKKTMRFLISILYVSFISIANAQEVRVIDNKGTIKTVKNNKVTTSLTAPTTPLEGDVWFDTSATSAVSKIYDGATWLIIDQDKVTTSATAPTIKNIGDIWLDTTVTPNTLNVWDGSSWVSFSQQDTQDLSIDATGKIISLVNGGNITINPNDADADATNELSDLSISGSILTLSNPATVGNSITLPRSLLSVTTTAAIANVNFEPTNNQVNNSEWISMNTALPTTTINVKTGDIVDVRVHISEDFSRYNDIGDVIRLDVNTPSLINSPTMIETLIAGRDNTF